MTRKKKTDQEIEYDNLLADIRTVMRGSPGRKFIWRILSLCDIYQNKQSTNPARTGAMIGREQIGLEILALLNGADPTIYPQMLMVEAKAKQAKMAKNKQAKEQEQKQNGDEDG